MALLDKLKEELDKAGRAAQGALDEGKIRLEAFRTRQLADKAAQALGYAVFRAKQNGGDVDSDTYTRLSSTLATHDSEAAKYESDLEDLKKQNRSWMGSTTPADAAPSAPADSTASATQSDPAAAPDATAQDISG